MSEQAEGARGVSTFTTMQFETKAQAEVFVAGRGFKITEMRRLGDLPSDFLVRIPK